MTGKQLLAMLEVQDGISEIKQGLEVLMPKVKRVEEEHAELVDALETLLGLHDAEVFVKEPWEQTFAQVRDLLARAQGGQE